MKESKDFKLLKELLCEISMRNECKLHELFDETTFQVGFFKFKCKNLWSYKWSTCFLEGDEDVSLMFVFQRAGKDMFAPLPPKIYQRFEVPKDFKFGGCYRIYKSKNKTEEIW